MTIAFLVAVAATGQTPKIDDLLQTSLKSLSFTATVGNAKQIELQKINKDFAQSYRFKTMEVYMKEPFMIRMETKVDDSEILMIINGPVRKLSIPKARISTRLNLKDEPGKRQTAFDFGLTTPSLFDGYFKAEFVRTERATGQHIFDVTYGAGLADKSRHRIWIDPAKKMVTKRQWYANWGGHLMATFDYSDPVQNGGIWLATTISVTNAEGKLAGTTTYKNLKVNPTLADSLFDVG